MEPIKILIVEDELIEAEGMRDSLEKSGYRVIQVVSSENEAMLEIERRKPDLILMDINLNGNTEGISAAKKIKEIYSLPIIYITHLQDQKIFKQAKETFPQNYLIKPFNDGDLIRSIELAIQNSGNWLKNRKITLIEQLKDGIFLFQTGSYDKIKLLYQDILFIKAAGAYSEIYYEKKGEVVTKPYKVSLSSNHVFAQIACSSIIRVHRSYYVNAEKITAFRNFVVYIHDIPIPVSQAFNIIVNNACKTIKHNVFKNKYFSLRK